MRTKVEPSRRRRTSEGRPRSPLELHSSPEASFIYASALRVIDLAKRGTTGEELAGHPPSPQPGASRAPQPMNRPIERDPLDPAQSHTFREAADRANESRLWLPFIVLLLIVGFVVSRSESTSMRAGRGELELHVVNPQPPD